MDLDWFLGIGSVWHAGLADLAGWGVWGDRRWPVAGGGGECVVAGGGNWVRLAYLFGETRCVGFLGGAAVAGAGKAADLKTEIRATGLRRSWAYKLLI